MLLTSLQRAPVSRQNVAALLFLAETSLYWLHCSDTTWQRVDLSPGWADRLQIGMLVFMRLFHHHMVGVLKRHDSFKNRLFAYLQGEHVDPTYRVSMSTPQLKICTAVDFHRLPDPRHFIVVRRKIWQKYWFTRHIWTHNFQVGPLRLYSSIDHLLIGTRRSLQIR